MLRFAIIEDEKTAANRLLDYIKRYCNVIGEEASTDVFEDGVGFFDKLYPRV